MGLRHVLKTRQQKKAHARYARERERQAELNREDAQRRVKEVAGEAGPAFVPLRPRHLGPRRSERRARHPSHTPPGPLFTRRIVERHEHSREPRRFPFLSPSAHEGHRSARMTSLLREE
jgi:hypothetical protein